MECGIDFGTTFSSISYYSDMNKPKECCLSIAGSEFIPTAVYISDEGWYSIGKRAYVDYVKMSNTGRYYTNPKRWIGATAANKERYEIKLKPKFRIQQTRGSVYSIDLEGNGEGKQFSFITPVELTYLFCKALLYEVEEHTGKMVTGVTCTVPADYNSFKRSYLSVAFANIGCPLRAFINEPTAAALAGSLRYSGGNRLISVFDFGGGTFDVSFIGFTGRVATVIESVGDNYLGGRDVDAALLTLVESKLKAGYDRPVLEQLISEAKEALSNGIESFDLMIPTASGVSIVNVSQEDLKTASLPFVEKAFQLFYQALRRLGSPPVVIVLTGGSSALPLVREYADEVPQKLHVVFDKSFFRLSVAIGAKIYSDILTGKSDLRLIDALTHTLSDEIRGLTPKVVFPKGHAIPASSTLTFTVSDGDVPYGVFEGEEPVSFLNELTFKATHHRSGIQGNQSTARYEISLDGRISLTVDGKKLVNEMIPPSVREGIKRLKYKSAQEEYTKASLLNYSRQFNDIYGVTPAEGDIKTNTGPIKEFAIEENYSSWMD